VIPPHRTRYLSEIAESNRKYDETALSQQHVAQNYMVFKTIESVSGNVPAITKVGIDDTTVYPSAIKEHDENNIFLNLLLNQFDKGKMV
jgi:methylmalonyl-CoA mutase